MFFYFALAIISLILFFTNLVEIMKKIKNNQPTTKNTIICTITLIYCWSILLLFASK
ncbi:MAG: hypothetical protein ACI33I_05530 [Clostridium sp.]